MIIKTCTFTGPHFRDLPWGRDESDEGCMEFKGKITMEIEKAINGGYYRFLSGVALGCDIYFAEIVLGLKKKYGGIRLECVIAYENQAACWPEDDRERYFNILAACDHETLFCRSRRPGCVNGAKRFMADQSHMLIAACGKGGPIAASGMAAYATGRGIPVVHIQV